LYSFAGLKEATRQKKLRLADVVKCLLIKQGIMLGILLLNSLLQIISQARLVGTPFQAFWTLFTNMMNWPFPKDPQLTDRKRLER